MATESHDFSPLKKSSDVNFGLSSGCTNLNLNDKFCDVSLIQSPIHKKQG